MLSWDTLAALLPSVCAVTVAIYINLSLSVWPNSVSQMQGSRKIVQTDKNVIGLKSFYIYIYGEHMAYVYKNNPDRY
jgi:hypothetical protein